MAATPETGFLLIADLTGYTAYLSRSEIEHAPTIAGDLLETVIGRLEPPFRLAKWRMDWLADDPRTPLKRMSGKIIQLASQMKPVCAWKFLDGWPCKWEGPDFDAAKTELAVETLEIAHSGLFFSPEGGGGSGVD